MDVQEYKCAGYSELSANIAPALIARAESEVKAAYIKPILPDYSLDDADVKQAVMCLAVLRIEQISVFATRSGAKEKTTAESYAADRAHIVSQYARTANMWLEQLRAKAGAKKDARINDICGIYFINTYFYN